jgi:hypothetical protein
MACQQAPAMGRISRAHGLLAGCPGLSPVREASQHRRGLLPPDGQAMDAAGNLNICAGLLAGIEGAIHAVRQATIAPPILPEPPYQPVPLQPPRTDPKEGLQRSYPACPPNPFMASMRRAPLGSARWAAGRFCGQSGTGGPQVPGLHSIATGTAPSSAYAGRANLFTPS